MNKLHHLNQLSILLFCLGILSCTSHSQQNSIEQSRLIILDSTVASDVAINTMIAPYKHDVDSITSRIIGTCTNNLKRGVPEAPLNNFVSDLMIDQANLYLAPLGEKAVQISIMNNHGLRAPLLKGSISIKNVFEVMPFENMLTLIEVKGSELQNIINQQAAKGGLAFGGVRMKIRNQRATQISIHGMPLDTSTIYRIVTSDYVVQGGDKIIDPKQILLSVPLGITIRDAIMQEIESLTKKNQPVNVTLDGRIDVK